VVIYSATTMQYRKLSVTPSCADGNLIYKGASSMYMEERGCERDSVQSSASGEKPSACMKEMKPPTKSVANLRNTANGTRSSSCSSSSCICF
jgi:hypothetical protein